MHEETFAEPTAPAHDLLCIKCLRQYDYAHKEITVTDIPRPFARRDRRTYQLTNLTYPRRGAPSLEFKHVIMLKAPALECGANPVVERVLFQTSTKYNVTMSSKAALGGCAISQQTFFARTTCLSYSAGDLTTVFLCLFVHRVLQNDI